MIDNRENSGIVNNDAPVDDGMHGQSPMLLMTEVQFEVAIIDALHRGWKRGFIEASSCVVIPFLVYWLYVWLF